METKDFEQTLVLIKPDALKHSLTGYVLSQLSEFHTGLRFAGSKIVNVNRMLAEEHYAEHKGKVFFESLLEYIMGVSHYPEEAWKRRVIALVYIGSDAILKIRGIAGPTNPHEARDERPGCIRSLGTLFPVKDDKGNVLDERMDNLIHASANQGDAEREIKLWFKPADLPPAMRTYECQASKEHYYYKDGKLFTVYEPGSSCLLAPGNVAWASDIEGLQQLAKGKTAACTLEAVAAKYLINEEVGQ